MKIKIDPDGFLKIKRGTNFKKIRCLLSEDEWCHDLCALFGEPEVFDKSISLELCYKTLRVRKEDFENER